MMISAHTQPKPPRLTPDEYLRAERVAETKSEYYNGEVVAMSGASLRHNRIVANLIFILSNHLRGSKCEVYPSDLRVWNPARRSYSYPDVTVVCGEPKLADEQQDVLLNPTMLIEVLSPSTERKDRGEKAEGYRRLESLREYLLVSQDRIHVERYTRQEGRFWLLSEAADLADSLQLDAIGCTLGLDDVYARVFDELEFETSSDSIQ